MAPFNRFRRQAPDANQVVPGLWVGSAPSHRDALKLRDAPGIDAVVDLRAEASRDSETWPREIDVRYVALTDHATPTREDLTAAAEVVVGLLRRGREVLVHCHAGIERGPLVVCAALVLTGWALEDAFNTVSKARPAAMPTDGQMAALRELADSERGRGMATER